MARCALHQPDQGPRTPLVHAILASPAMCLVDLKAEWGETRQPLRESVRNYPDNELTNIRDKVFVLLGIAEDASDVVVDYNESLKEVLISVVKPAALACSLLKSRVEKGN
jgi:hypothetical protein